jgi:hypothetical protein
MTDEPTCGKGLAQHASLPALLGQLTAAVADVLEHHTTGLDTSDPNSARERDVYQKLVQEHRETAAQLAATSERMTAARDMPMGAHNIDALSDPAAFKRLVEREEQLVQLLQTRLEQDRAMLAAMSEG